MHAIQTSTASGQLKISRRIGSEQSSERVFFGVSVLLFVASAAVTIVWSGSMSAMGEMRMPGGWTMAMAWMRMPGQTLSGAVPWHVARDHDGDDAAVLGPNAAALPPSR